ncbi:MAG: hypothetical protein Q8L20_10895 [Gammaproteobacteria bacterium]|nr:hypothetical protein [Gammaproteobacteria bacterium]
MSEIVVGLDPDSKEHGVAVYVDGVLTELLMLNLPALRRWIAQQTRPLRFSIEDVLAQNFVYAAHAKPSKAAHAAVGVSIGRCQQAQTEVMRELDDCGIPYVLHKPTGANWAKKKELFERLTGWRGRSNSETRSAAYFGFVAVRQTRARGASA